MNEGSDGRGPEDRPAGASDGRNVGNDPDPRFGFANERTYLAWNRTALAMIAGGLVVAQFLKTGVAGLQLIVALPLIAFGAVLSLWSYRNWQRNREAMRRGDPIPASALPRALLYGVILFAASAAVLAVIRFTAR
jgi:putative membrane protein